jgi:hypothetical protein
VEKNDEETSSFEVKERRTRARKGAKNEEAKTAEE